MAAINELRYRHRCAGGTTGDDIAEIVLRAADTPAKMIGWIRWRWPLAFPAARLSLAVPAANDDLILNGTAMPQKLVKLRDLQSAGGNVGVNTTTPGQALDVAYGNFRFTPVPVADAPAVAVRQAGSNGWRLVTIELLS